MGKPVCVIATIKPWNIIRARQFARANRSCRVYLITEKNKLTYEFLKLVRPRYVFFIHWSWKIPARIYDHFDCIAFHMTDLPFGRGGSPLQNLIARGITKTKISAFKIIEKMDAGPVYFKRTLSLNGNAGDIFSNAADIMINTMIPHMIRHKPKATPQKGRPVVFRRRVPAQSDISRLGTLEQVFDHIRMLDAETYPRAFMRGRKFRVEFTDANRTKNEVTAKVKIIMEDKT